MSQMIEQREAVDVNRLLAGAAKTVPARAIAGSRPPPSRPSPSSGRWGGYSRDPGEDEWTIRFLTDGRSRKAADMRREGEVAILFQHDPDLAFVTLIGKSALHDSASEVRERWKRAYDSTFRLKRTGRTQSSSRSRSSGWNSGSAASRRSRSDCARPC